ncbi:MAG: hypothetical protein C4B59_11230 [Candidatus Methanogaster sp.]|uniref:Uncharacterized protein n=1 Tax=Candidatus Methanogaster sp. TaxID=3386292 RepID=A0AC61L0R0_9EURY|nr:MAG: hypothetical protein C4B59_11230 [ANME-2 cluster archaeon]
MNAKSRVILTNNVAKVLKHEQKFNLMVERACNDISKRCIKMNDGRLLRMEYVMPPSVDKKLHHRLPHWLPLPFGAILPRNVWMATPM